LNGVLLVYREVAAKLNTVLCLQVLLSKVKGAYSIHII